MIPLNNVQVSFPETDFWDTYQFPQDIFLRELDRLCKELGLNSFQASPIGFGPLGCLGMACVYLSRRAIDNWTFGPGLITVERPLLEGGTVAVFFTHTLPSRLALKKDLWVKGGSEPLKDWDRSRYTGSARSSRNEDEQGEDTEKDDTVVNQSTGVRAPTLPSLAVLSSPPTPGSRKFYSIEIREATDDNKGLRWKKGKQVPAKALLLAFLIQKFGEGWVARTDLLRRFTATYGGLIPSITSTLSTAVSENLLKYVRAQYGMTARSEYRAQKKTWAYLARYLDVDALRASIEK